jgi:hypothetical protein
MELIALRPLVYASKRMKAGDRFSTRGGQDARLLKALGHAADAPPPVVVEPEPVKRTYMRRDMVVEPPKVQPIEPPQGPAWATDFTSETVELKPKRQYRRRDQTAE